MTPQPIPSAHREQLEAIRNGLLELHKILLDRERKAYEQEHGSVGSTGNYLQLVLSHENFVWLREISSLVARIDEALAPRSKAGEAEASALKTEARNLLARTGSENAFETRYWKAVEQDPDILVQHGKIARMLQTEAKE